MPWIKLVSEQHADGIVGRAYETALHHYGRVPNVLKALSPRPKALQRHTPLFREIMFGEGELSRLERELVAVVVSTINGCGYCTTTHGYGMEAEGADPDLVRALQEDPAEAPLDGPHRELVRYMIKLTRHPSSVSEIDIDNLRESGWTDGQIHDAILVNAFFNYVNRFVEATGVDIESDRREEPVEDKGIYG